MTPRTANADRYWAQYLESLSPERRPGGSYVEAFFFGIVPADAPAISPLVLDGTKTATGSLFWSYEADPAKHLPGVGDHWIFTNGADDPVGIIRTIEVRVIPYDEVTPDYAWEGGERDRSMATWRDMYWRYIVAECKRLGREPSAKAPLVMERFRVVYGEPFRGVTP